MTAPRRTVARRVKGRPRFSLTGMVGGVLLGVSALVLLQQQGAVYPTMNTTIGAAVAGLALGVLLPTLFQLRAASKANRRLRR
jgi:hypothetical protein